MAIKCQPKSIMREPHKCGNKLAKFVSEEENQKWKTNKTKQKKKTHRKNHKEN